MCCSVLQCVVSGTVIPSNRSERVSPSLIPRAQHMTHSHCRGDRRMRRRVLQHTATHCNVLQRSATNLQHTATHCNTTQHTSTPTATCRKRDEEETWNAFYQHVMSHVSICCITHLEKTCHTYEPVATIHASGRDISVCCVTHLEETCHAYQYVASRISCVTHDHTYERMMAHI